MRLRELDVLRTAAIALVLFHHWDDPVPALPLGLDHAVRTVREAGWIGVDLFFVLSGFLVAGLLFREIRVRGEIRFGRFFVRRGFKIYPAFYTFLLVIVALPLMRGKTPPWGPVLAEALFVQNYADRLQIHTWSLAVEEHFYLLLPLYLIWASRRPNFQAALPRHFLLLAGVVLALRIATSLLLPYRTGTHGYPTHLRIDSLCFGSLLAFFAHFYGPGLKSFVQSRTPLLFGVSAAGLSAAFLLDEANPWMHTAGFSGLYLGFGGVLLLALYGPWETARGWRGKLVDALAWVGSYSYGIYLWHMFMRTYVLMALTAVLRRPLPYGVGLALYLAGCVVLGVVMTKLIERPFLALRERWFPARDAQAAGDAVLAAR